MPIGRLLFASGDLKFAHDLPLSEEIKSDWLPSRCRRQQQETKIITQSRSAGGHGDLGIAVIVGAFASQYLRPKMVTTHTLRGWF